MADICTSSVKFLFFENEGVNKIFFPPKPSDQQDLPVLSGTGRHWACVRICLGYWSTCPLTGNTKQQAKNLKRVDVFEDVSYIF